MQSGASSLWDLWNGVMSTYSHDYTSGGTQLIKIRENSHIEFCCKYRFTDEVHPIKQTCGVQTVIRHISTSNSRLSQRLETTKNILRTSKYLVLVGEAVCNILLDSKFTAGKHEETLDYYICYDGDDISQLDNIIDKFISFKGGSVTVTKFYIDVFLSQHNAATLRLHKRIYKNIEQLMMSLDIHKQFAFKQDMEHYSYYMTKYSELFLKTGTFPVDMWKMQYNQYLVSLIENISVGRIPFIHSSDFACCSEAIVKMNELHPTWRRIKQQHSGAYITDVKSLENLYSRYYDSKESQLVDAMKNDPWNVSNIVEKRLPPPYFKICWKHLAIWYIVVRDVYGVCNDVILQIMRDVF